ncbi:MAG: helix-turn-helix transcriptional regulator [Planctomycetota bacterium]
METGRKILNLRKDLGVQQKTLAGLTAVTPSALSRIEAGVHQPRGPVALRLARQLGVTVDYLLDDDAPYPPPAREILANLDNLKRDEARSLQMRVTRGEQNLMRALRSLEPERRLLLENALNAPRDKIRLGVFLLGDAQQLPGVDREELDRFKSLLLRVAEAHKGPTA